MCIQSTVHYQNNMNYDNNIKLILLSILVLRRSMAQSPTEAKKGALGVCTNIKGKI